MIYRSEEGRKRRLRVMSGVIILTGETNEIPFSSSSFSPLSSLTSPFSPLPFLLLFLLSFPLLSLLLLDLDLDGSHFPKISNSGFLSSLSSE